MKIKVLLMSILLAVALLTGCAANDEPEQNEQEQNEPEPNEPEETTPDVVTTASIVMEEEPFLNAISAQGTWIICTLRDLEFDQDLVIEGEFHNKDDQEQELYRKLALYSQDEDHNVTARFSLTAPKMTIKSPNTRIQGGKFIGDVYVESNGFSVVDATIEGNVYFASEEYKSSLVLDKGGTITGAAEVKE